MIASSSRMPHASEMMAVNTLKEICVRAVFLYIVLSCSAEALKPAKEPAEARYSYNQLSSLP